jgi:hypothetical protein
MRDPTKATKAPPRSIPLNKDFVNYATLCRLSFAVVRSQARCANVHDTRRGRKTETKAAATRYDKNSRMPAGATRDLPMGGL